jgi:cytochrome c oxidase subunit 2
VTTTLIVLGWIGWLIYTFREKIQNGSPEPDDAPSLDRPPVERGDLQHVWMVAGAVMFATFFLTFQTITTLPFYDNPPDEGDEITIMVYGRQFSWRFEYPNGNSSYTTLTVPQDRAIILKVTSEDVYHNFAIPDLKIKIDAIPDHVNTIWFEVDETGEHEIMCMEMCGAGHPMMRGTLKVVEAADYTGGE